MGRARVIAVSLGNGVMDRGQELSGTQVYRCTGIQVHRYMCMGGVRERGEGMVKVGV